jgi:hypothetical protein
MYVKTPDTKHNAYSCTYSSQPRDKYMKQDHKNTYSMQQTLADTGGLFLKYTMDDKFGDSVNTSWILTTLTVSSLNTKGIHSLTCQDYQICTGP